MRGKAISPAMFSVIVLTAIATGVAAARLKYRLAK